MAVIMLATLILQFFAAPGSVLNATQRSSTSREAPESTTTAARSRSVGQGPGEGFLQNERFSSARTRRSRPHVEQHTASRAPARSARQQFPRNTYVHLCVATLQSRQLHRGDVQCPWVQGQFGDRAADHLPHVRGGGGRGQLVESVVAADDERRGSPLDGEGARQDGREIGEGARSVRRLGRPVGQRSQHWKTVGIPISLRGGPVNRNAG